MPKTAKGLTDRQVQTKGPGMYACGQGLYLQVIGASRSWLFRYQLKGQRHAMGLGSYPAITLQEATKRTLKHKAGLFDDIDPLANKTRGRAASRHMITFKQAAELCIAVHNAGRKDKDAWPASMRRYVFPIIGELPVNQIDRDRVLAVLEPIWQTKTTAAVAVRARMEAVLNYAATKEYRDANAANPASWERLKNLLVDPKLIKKVEHRAAMPAAELPEFMSKLAADNSIPAAALAFTILTCVRAGEVAGATWQEIDFAGRTWTIPAERMKGGKEHRVPLTAPALTVLHRMAQIKSNSNDCIFLGRDGSSITAKTILRALLKIAPDVTTHGFRSTFSTWCAETNRDHRLCETSLAHVVGSAVERSYQRSDLLDKRRVLMEEWARHCGSLG